MRKIALILFFAFIFYFPMELIGQISTTAKLINSIAEYQGGLVNRNGDPLIYQPLALNLFFNEEVGKYFTKAGEATSQKSYFSLEAEDNSLTFGHVFTKENGNQLKNLKWVPSIGFKLKGEQEGTFYTLVDDEGLRSNFGITGKLTYFFDGKINYKASDERINQQKLTIERQNVIGPEVAAELSQSFIDTNNIETKSKLEMAKRELAFIKENNLYTYISKFWITLDFYVPITGNDYKTTLFSPDSLNRVSTTNNWDASLSGTALLKRGKTSMTFVASIRVFNNNNILTEAISENKFTQFAQDSIQQFNQFLQVEEKSIYVGEFEEFITPQIKGELTFYPCNEWIGLSGAVEQNFGDYGALNWKFGIPFNLKDKKDKASIAFELQWREVNKEHFIGISIGKAFGKFIN